MSPAREIRTASETEEMMWVWPVTRAERDDSTSRSLERSDWRREEVGIPVALATTREMSEEVTRSWRENEPVWSDGSGSDEEELWGSWRSRSGMVEKRRREASSYWP